MSNPQRPELRLPGHAGAVPSTAYGDSESKSELRIRFREPVPAATVTVASPTARSEAMA